MKTNELAGKAVEDYMSTVSNEHIEVLKKLRRTVKKIVPESKERVAYGIICVSLDKDLIAYASQKHHCSFYTMSPGLVKKMSDELAGLKISGATIHFQPDKPIPDKIIRKILRERLKEMAELKAKNDNLFYPNIIKIPSEINQMEFFYD
jgi:uncharacterized protein YdhG (YjbR/CyaY superfamily)